MKSFKKVFMVLLCMMMVFTLSSCTDNPEVPETEELTNNENDEKSKVDIVPHTEEISSSILDQVKSSGKIIVATSADYPPYEFHIMKDGKDEIVGAEIEMAKYIASELGVEAEIQDMGFDGVLQSVQNGMADIGIAAIAATEERKEVFEISDPYQGGGYDLLIRKEDADKFKTIEDLEGKDIGVQIASIQEKYINDEVGYNNIVALSKLSDLVLQLENGMIDCMLAGKSTIDNYAKTSENLVAAGVDFSGTAMMDGGQSVITRKGDAKLIEEINKIIKKIQDEGLFDKWLEDAKVEADKLVDEN